MKEKITRACQNIFAYVMGALMIVALAVAVAYIAAFIAGVPYSEAICSFIGIYILPAVYIIGIAVCVIGIISMYLKNEHVFMLTLPEKKK